MFDIMRNMYYERIFLKNISICYYDMVAFRYDVNARSCFRSNRYVHMSVAACYLWSFKNIPIYTLFDSDFVAL